MVQEIRAYQASDGLVFENAHDAVRHEAEIKLLKIFDNNIKIANDLLDRLPTVIDELVGYSESLKHLTEKAE